jgi:uncharacterized membrane protein YagU involved in acid resistance
MKTKIQKSILAGIIGTAVMTAVMMVAPMMGMPKMSPPNMLASTMGMPIAVGWIMHFVIGIIFATIYTFLLSCLLPGKPLVLKGILFGIIAFIFAQIMMALMGAMLPMPKMEGSMMMNMMGSLVGHIIFGIAVVLTVGNTVCTAKK